jgi:hypothetical protein
MDFAGGTFNLQSGAELKRKAGRAGVVREFGELTRIFLNQRADDRHQTRMNTED